MADNKVFTRELVAETVGELNIADLENATIGEILLVASALERKTGIPFIRMDQGSPGLPPNKIGIEAEKEALDSGIVSQYPAAAGVAELKEQASRFVRAFLDVEISPEACIPTTGGVAASFASFIAATQRLEGKDKVLFIDPGFPIQKSQLKILGIEWVSFDIHDFRGERLRAKMEPLMRSGEIAAIVYSNPNNPAWICLEDSELKIIGELADRYDAVVMEDMAYFCMDFRRDLGRPFEPPYPPTVARYTDNYILLLSSSKIFSYAGQRIALACISDALFNSHYENLARRYGDSGIFGQTFIASILYMITSGCTTSTQFAYARMLKEACDGRIDFVADTRIYAERAERMKQIFRENGFRIVYDRDVSRQVGDGFFFTLGYGEMSGGELLRELLHYGVSCISLATTGSEQQGIRACTSRMKEELYPLLRERMEGFRRDHPVEE